MKSRKQGTYSSAVLNRSASDIVSDDARGTLEKRSHPAMKIQVRRNRVLALGKHEIEEIDDWCNDT